MLSGFFILFQTPDTKKRLIQRRITMDTITVRNAVPEDAPRILEIYSYYVKHTAITFEYAVPTLEEFQKD